LTDRLILFNIGTTKDAVVFLLRRPRLLLLLLQLLGGDATSAALKG